MSFSTLFLRKMPFLASKCPFWPFFAPYTLILKLTTIRKGGTVSLFFVSVLPLMLHQRRHRFIAVNAVDSLGQDGGDGERLQLGMLFFWGDSDGVGDE